MEKKNHHHAPEEQAELPSYRRLAMQIVELGLEDLAPESLAVPPARSPEIIALLGKFRAAVAAERPGSEPLPAGDDALYAFVLDLVERSGK
jgi:hypothetical protein